MLFVPAQSMATHNSVGADLEITRADEVNDDGELAPDLTNDSRIWNFSQRFHYSETQDSPAPERIGPTDQSGSHYNPDDCRAFSEFEGDADGSQIDHYEAALPGVDSDIAEEKDACWVGLLDDQVEYMVVGNLAGANFLPIIFGGEPPFPEAGFGPVSTHCITCTPTGEEDEDPLYFLNPEAGDDDCDRPDTSEECASKSHTAYWPSFSKAVAIDSDLLEVGIGSDADNPAPTSAAEAGGTSQGSGTVTLPLLFTYKTFLFGYSHPTTDASDITASDIDQPAWGVPSNACGDRTPECHLITPADLDAYDDTWQLSDDIEETDKGRLCSYSPQYVTVNPAGAEAGPCGIFGDEITSFYATTEAGGFGTGTVNTYQANLPGYKEGVVALGSTSSLAPIDWTFRLGSDNTTGGERQYYGADTFEALERIVAVNPVVPDSNHPANCVRPNMVSDGTQVKDSKAWDAQEVADEFDLTLAEAEAIGELDAPGIYGDFQAHAIDNDAYSNAFTGYVQTLYTGEGVDGYDGYRETFGPVLGTADSAAGDATSTAQNLADQAVDQVPDELPGQDTLDDTVDQLDDVLNRLETGQADDSEPTAEPGDPNFETFENTPEVEAGVTCQGSSLELVDDPDAIPGRLNHDAELDRTLLALEDPTILDDESLPANKSETSEGAWHTEAYSFSGPLVAYFDKGGDEGFDGCDPADGQPDDSLDDCAWIPVWDAYNPNCTKDVEGVSVQCSDVLAQNGYDVGPGEADNVDLSDEPTPHGVGLVATVELTGTTLLTNQPSVSSPLVTVDNSQIINQDPTARTCVVITSQGFDEYLDTHIDGVSTFEDAAAELCSSEADDIVRISDGFENQGGPNDRGFASTVSWVPLVPTPDAVRDAAEIGDQRLCVSAVFSTQESVLGTGGASGTKSTVNLGDENTETIYTDCDVISQELQDGEATAHTGYEGTSYSFPASAHAGS